MEMGLGMGVRGEGHERNRASESEPKAEPESGSESESEPGEQLPDLLSLGLVDLRTIQHPVLSEVLADLRERAGQPSEMLWGFNNAF
ncbi:FxSxx-COOH cyclophane-containing RiPP peptide [Streptomyces sp. NPDC050704]|uniref:FxSxx-COOH cyclophane-containing RiPP peptide n=1 Tax=Streptomyces sp. NPDC050704 TaxID=3157219 RepID=UPI003431ADD0